MDKEKVKQILESNGYRVILDKPYGKSGHRLKVEQGSAVICYNSNKWAVKGKLREPLEHLLSEYKNEFLPNNKVFIAYGHDEKAKVDLERMVRDWDLEPLLIDNLPTGGRTIIEQLEHYIPQCNFAIVLATPDDIGYLKGKEKDKKSRARQNVILELGLLYSKLGRKRVAVIIKDGEEFEKPSDIDGVLYCSYCKKGTETSEKIRKELKQNGYVLA